MDRRNDNNPSFPEGYEHVEERLNKTKELLEQLDKQIENAPYEPGPAPMLSPIGTVIDRRTGYHERRVAFLKDQEERVKANTWEKTEADTRNGDSGKDRLVRDITREKLFPNPFRGMSKEEKLQANAKIEDLVKSQDYIEAKQDYFDATRLDKAAKYNIEKEDKDVAPQPQSKDTMSLSARFTMSLGYTKVSERVREHISREPQPMKED